MGLPELPQPSLHRRRRFLRRQILQRSFSLRSVRVSLLSFVNLINWLILVCWFGWFFEVVAFDWCSCWMVLMQVMFVFGIGFECIKIVQTRMVLLRVFLHYLFLSFNFTNILFVLQGIWTNKQRSERKVFFFLIHPSFSRKRGVTFVQSTLFLCFYKINTFWLSLLYRLTCLRKKKYCSPKIICDDLWVSIIKRKCNFDFLTF